MNSLAWLSKLQDIDCKDFTGKILIPEILGKVTEIQAFERREISFGFAIGLWLSLSGSLCDFTFYFYDT
jgi:hypothetical protein